MSRPLDAFAPVRRPADGLALRVALAAIRTYKLTLSPLFTGACRFHPSCSTYAADALRAHGVWAGIWLAVCRLARCHPFGGLDTTRYRLAGRSDPFGVTTLRCSWKSAF